DLDIETLTILEEYINYFDGPVITVSHDRYFLDKVCNKIFSFEENGEIRYTMGNYQDYHDIKTEKNIENVQLNKSLNKANSESSAENFNHREDKNKKIKLSYKEQREYENIEDEIRKIEEKLESIIKKLQNSGSDFVKLQELTIEQENTENVLMEKMERLEYFEKILEDSQKG
ncbi:MAG: ABC transporter ATP-binding protein, partial [Proteocatella sp.]